MPRTQMYEYVYARCALVTRSKEFIDIWMATKGKPCTQCEKENCDVRLGDFRGRAGRHPVDG